MPSYSLGPGYRVFIFFLTAFFSLGVVITASHLATANESIPVKAFLAAWICLAVFGIYWYLFRYVYDLRFDNEWLYWRTPLRSGSVRLHELHRIAARWGTDGIIQTTDGRRIRVLAQKGFARFCAQLAAQCPGLEVHLGWMSRFLEWLPASTMFRG